MMSAQIRASSMTTEGEEVKIAGVLITTEAHGMVGWQDGGDGKRR
jgi:hypothetical protein